MKRTTGMRISFIRGNIKKNKETCLSHECHQLKMGEDVLKVEDRVLKVKNRVLKIWDLVQKLWAWWSGGAMQITFHTNLSWKEKCTNVGEQSTWSGTLITENPLLWLIWVSLMRAYLIKTNLSIPYCSSNRHFKYSMRWRYCAITG